MANVGYVNSPKLKVPLLKLNNPLDQSFEINLDPFGTTFDSTGRPSIFGKESLQILHNLPHLKDFDVSGRDSLGILNLNDVLIGDNNETSTSKDLTNCLLSDNSSRDISPLNTAMCEFDSPCKRKPSSYSSLSSFNSISLNVPEPSRIWSTSSIERSELNNGFIKTHLLSESRSILNDRIFDDHSRGRVLSLPTIFGETKRISGIFYKTEIKSENIKGSSNFGLDIDDDNYNDSVFIEANHLASKIADGSILDKSCEDDVNILNSTPQPDLINDSELNLSIEERPDTETVYKIIDKMLPPISDNNLREDTSKAKLPSPVPTDEISVKSKSQESAFSDSHLSTDVKDILNKLSTLITSGEKDIETKTLGQNLIANLSSLLSIEKSPGHTGSFDDSNSSSHKKNLQILEDSGYSKKRNSSEGSPRVLDLSLKNRLQDIKESMSQSFDHPGSKTLAPRVENNLQKQMMKLSGTLGRRHSDDISRNVAVVDMKAGRSLSNFGKFKPKKFEGASKKGPLKAVIPFTKIEENSDTKKLDAKEGSKQSTPKSQNKPIFISKKTSTPIEDPKIKPLAQSTPDKEESNQSNIRACSSMIRNRKLSCPISPLARPISRTLRSLELNKSDSLPDLGKKILMEANNNKALSRRNSSVVDLKREQIPKIKRSFSLGKENSLHLQDNDRKSNTKTNVINGTSGKKSENRSFLQENIRRVSGMKPFNLMATLKKSGRTSTK